MISDIINIPYKNIIGKIIFSSNELLKDHIIIKNSICDYVTTIDNFTIYNIDIISAFNFVYNNINLLKDMSYKLRWAAILTADSLKDIEILLGDDLLPM